MGMDVGGPSVMKLYSQAGEQGTPPDVGQAYASSLAAAELAHRSHYATPAIPGRQEPPPGRVGAGPGDIPIDYNLTEGMPVKYSVPSAQKERLATREMVRDAIRLSEKNQTPGVIRTDPITDEEINFVKSMKDQAELADLDRYVNIFFDPRKPGNLPKLMEIYPEFVDRRIQQTKTDYEYALRSQMIDQWGVNTFDDLLFLYWRDQGKISGPNLLRRKSVDHKYAAGYLSPFHWGVDTGIHSNGGDIMLPFASANYGKRPLPGQTTDWSLPDFKDQPLSLSRGTRNYASALYGDEIEI